MEYAISFLEGITTFISPCLLPMLPVYVAFFAGGGAHAGRAAVKNAAGFVLGFTVLFVALGAFAGLLGGFLARHTTAVNLVTGGIVVVFGLHYTGLLRIPFLERTRRLDTDVRPVGFFSAALFGMVFAVGWTPCVGAFLGSALMLAAQQGSFFQGLFMLLCYSLGLGIPFLLSALLIERLKGAFTRIKRHYRTVNLICGGLLIVLGLAMMTGWMQRLLSALSV